jgi:hypothetical protein
MYRHCTLGFIPATAEGLAHIVERARVFRIGRQSRFGLQHDSNRPDGRELAIGAGRCQLHVIIDSRKILVKTFGSKPLVSSR